MLNDWSNKTPPNTSKEINLIKEGLFDVQF